MEESLRKTVSNLTDNVSNVSKCAKDSLTSYSTNNQSTFKSFSSSTNRTTLSVEEIESRRSGFSQFINSLPKICSPTICGTLNYQTPNSRIFKSTCSANEATKKSENDTESGYHTSSQNKVDENSTLSNCNKDGESTSDYKEEYKNPFEEKINKKLDEFSAKSNGEDAIEQEDNNEFDWSIDQIALLNPCDITFDNFLLYKEFEELNRSMLNKESEEFFKQNVIAPSPIVNTPIIARKRLIQNTCKTSSPFMDYLNSKKKSMFKTPLQLSSIKSMTPGLSSKTPRTCTPINELSVLENLPKKKLFHKLESSSLMKSAGHSNDSPTLSEINSTQNQFNCTDLDVHRFSLDFSEIGDEINLTESNHVIKSSTNRKEMFNRLIKEDLLEEDENEIQQLDLNDTNEAINHDLKDDLQVQLENDLKDDGLKGDLKDAQIDLTTTNLMSEEVTKTNEDDVHMCISIQPVEQVANNTSLMDFSFQALVPVVVSPLNNVNQLLNQIPKTSTNQINDQLNFELQTNDDNQMMETSMCSPDNFNGKIDTACKKTFHTNPQLTSTPFRF